jgi:hypothetical protein
MTNELPSDTWTEIISFSKPREIYNILLLSSSIHAQLNENDSMWKQLSYSLYGDKSVSEKIRRVSKKAVDEKKQQEINSRQKSIIRDEQSQIYLFILKDTRSKSIHQYYKTL